MITVEGEILRGSCTPVYFVGETIEAIIRFKCTPPVDTRGPIKKKQSPGGVESAPASPRAAASLVTPPAFTRENSNDSMFSVLSHSSHSSFDFKTTAGFDLAAAAGLHTTGTSRLDEHIVLWACAQIDCHCHIDESKVMLPKDPLRYNTGDKGVTTDAASVSTSSTSFQPNKDRAGISLYSSKPKILFCNLALKPNQTKSCKA